MDVVARATRAAILFGVRVIGRVATGSLQARFEGVLAGRHPVRRPPTTRNYAPRQLARERQLPPKWVWAIPAGPETGWCFSTAASGRTYRAGSSRRTTSADPNSRA